MSRGPIRPATGRTWRRRFVWIALLFFIAVLYGWGFLMIHVAGG